MKRTLTRTGLQYLMNEVKENGHGVKFTLKMYFQLEETFSKLLRTRVQAVKTAKSATSFASESQSVKTAKSPTRINCEFDSGC